MKEHPILFSGPMVRAILEGKKTMTRRVIKPPIEVHQNGNEIWLTRPKNFKDEYCRFHPYEFSYGAGDRLWVKETINVSKYGGLWFPDDAFESAEVKVEYMADNFIQYLTITGEDKQQFKPGIKPSIFMSRWASRILLQIDDIRLERLQDISDQDCESEGVRPSIDGNAQDWRQDETGWKRTFRQLWDSINFTSGYGWDVNPWVKIISFHRIEV